MKQANFPVISLTLFTATWVYAEYTQGVQYELDRRRYNYSYPASSWENRFMKTLYTLTLIFAAFTNATAAVVLYDESLSGDLAPQPSLTPDVDEPLMRFTLHAGENQVRGDMNLRAVTGIPFDVDAFSITIPDGLFLDSISFETTRTIGGADFLAMAVSTGLQFNNSNIDDPPRPPILGTLATPIPGATTNPQNPAIFPLGPGDYSVSFELAVLDGPIQENNPFQWTAHLNTTSVPEPSAFAMFTLSALFAAVRRRRWIANHNY